MRILLKRVLFSRIWASAFIINLGIIAYFKTKYPLLNLPLFMYPIAVTLHVWCPLRYYLVPEFLSHGSSSIASSLYYMPTIGTEYKTAHEGRIITIDAARQTKKNHTVLWIAGGGFTSCDSRDYIPMASRLVQGSRGPVSVSVLCCTPPNMFSPSDLVYPNIHESCADSLVTFSVSVKTRHKSFLTIVADDTGASLLISMLQYLKSLRRKVYFHNVLFISPISHFHHMDFPSSPQKKFTEPVPYFCYKDHVHSWIEYLVGETNEKLYKLLKPSEHISPSIRNSTPPYLVYWTSTYTFLRKKEFRESYYYNPKAIRTFNHFVDDPLLNPLLKPQLLVESFRHTKKILTITLMNSANRDDGLFLTDFLETILPQKNPRVQIDNFFMHGGFTGCLRFSPWFDSCPDLVDQVHRVIYNWTSQTVVR